MTAEEQFHAYKADFDKKLLKKARIQSTILGSATVIAILGVMYGLINNIEVGTQKDLASWNEQKAIEAKLEADKLRDGANELQSQNAELKAQLDACSARNVKDARQACGKALAAAEEIVQVNLERAVKAEESARRSQQLCQAYQKKAEQMATDLKMQLDKCKSGK